VREVLLQAALNGPFGKGDHPAMPVSIEELARENARKKEARRLARSERRAARSNAARASADDEAGTGATGP